MWLGGFFPSIPIVGVGNETFTDVNPYKKDTHNLFMRSLAEQGSIGLLILVGLLLSILRASWRALRESPTGSLGYALGLGMIGAWLALVIGNFWGDRFTYTQMIGYFWVFVGLTLKARDLAVAERDGPSAIAPVSAPTTPASAGPKVARVPASG